MLLPMVLSLAVALAFQAAAYSQLKKHPLDGKGDEQILKELEEIVQEREQERASRAPDPKLPRQDPCSVLTDADVRKVLKDAKPGRRGRRALEERGTSVCEWRTDRGRHVIFYLEADSPRGDLSARDSEPLPPAYRKLSGIGDEAYVLVMRRDDKVGQPDMAFLGARKGKLTFRIEFNDIVQISDEKVIALLRELALAAVSRI